MVEIVASPMGTVPTASTVDTQRERRQEILWALFRVLDEAGVPYCLLRGYQGFPAAEAKDIDLLVAAEWLPHRLAALLSERREQIGAEVVQWNAANYVVLAALTPGSPVFIHLDLATELQRAGRCFYRGAEVLVTRRRYEGWWAPAVPVEFAYYLAEKLIKERLLAEDGERLSRIYHQAPEECAAEVRRLWSPAAARIMLAAAESASWEAVRGRMLELRADLLDRAPRSDSRVLGRLGEQWRRAKRWLRPTEGLHVVLLGPDGVGKSSVIEAVRRELAPAFGGPAFYDAFAPSLVPQRAADLHVRAEQGPHALPPRGLTASLAKGVYWTLFYSLGYYATIYPALARTSLAINHRYLVDALVDQRRYRYSGPRWLLAFAWRLARKPDLLILLDAPAEVIQRRKSEVAFEETARQQAAYRAIVEPLANGRIVDASRPLGEVVAEVEELILGYMARRAARRFDLEAAR